MKTFSTPGTKMDKYLKTTDGKLVLDPDGNPLPLDSFDQDPSDKAFEGVKEMDIVAYAKSMGFGWMFDDEEKK